MDNHYAIHAIHQDNENSSDFNYLNHYAIHAIHQDN